MSDVELVRDIYRAMAERDLDRLLELIDPACVITQDPALPWGGRHVGHDGFATFALALTGTIDSVVTIEAIFAADDDVIQYGRTRGTVAANGAASTSPRSIAGPCATAERSPPTSPSRPPRCSRPSGRTPTSPTVDDHGVLGMTGAIRGGDGRR